MSSGAQRSCWSSLLGLTGLLLIVGIGAATVWRRDGVYLDYPGPEPPGLRERLAAAIAETRGAAGAPPIELGALTDFEWDGCFVVTPYATGAHVNAGLGFDWMPPRREFEGTEGQVRLGFVREGRVVGTLLWSRPFGDFGTLERPGFVTPRGAMVFRVRWEESLGARAWSAWPYLDLAAPASQPSALERR